MNDNRPFVADQPGLCEITATVTLDGTIIEQNAVYLGNPLDGSDAELVSGPDLRDGIQVHQTGGTAIEWTTETSPAPL